MNARRTALQTTVFWLTVGCLCAVQFKLLAAQTLFGLAALLWAVLEFTNRKRPELPAFWLPLTVYAALTLVSAAFSIDPKTSLIDCKQLVLFLMVPIVASVARGDRAALTLNAVMALGAAAAMIGVVEFLLLGYDNLENRPTGLLSHYMTYSGVLMLVTCAAAARLIFRSKQVLWPAIAVPALVLALVFTMSRSAWVGALVAIGLLLGIRRFRLIMIVPAIVLVFFVLAPAVLKQRAYSIFDPTEGSNRDRLQMLVIGARVVRDHPLFGVGPEMIERVYPDYRPADAVHPVNVHLHNVPMQIAAERGLLALAAWLWFVAVALRDLWRQLVRGPAQTLAATGLAAVVAMLAAGLFEYNFGDSEFLMLFLGLITLPFAGAKPRT